MIGKETDIGIDQKLLDRTTPIRGHARLNGANSMIFEWGMGNITLSLASDIGLNFTTALSGEPKFLTSTLTVRATHYRDVLGRPSIKRDSFEVLSAMLSLISTANAVAERANTPLTHLVRSNASSIPYFERFSQAGLYYLSDLGGNATGQPVTYRDPETLKRDTLFACQMPNARITDGLGKFVIPAAVKQMGKMLQG